MEIVSDIQQAIWLLDGEATELTKLRADGGDFGPSCPNTVNENFFGTPMGDIFFIDQNIYFTSQHFFHPPSSALA